jgi:hypothetical protein
LLINGSSDNKVGTANGLEYLNFAALFFFVKLFGLFRGENADELLNAIRG